MNQETLTLNRQQLRMCKRVHCNSNATGIRKSIQYMGEERKYETSGVSVQVKARGKEEMAGR